MTDDKENKLVESIKETGKLAKEYFIDDTINDINKIKNNLEIKKKGCE